MKRATESQKSCLVLQQMGCVRFINIKVLNIVVAINMPGEYIFNLYLYKVN
jgi:hypothetical protein